MLLSSTPESAGLPSSAVTALLDRLEGQEIHSLMLLRDGKTLAEGWWKPYRRERPHRLFSLSKSFTSTAIGLAVEEGRLTVEDRVVDFFPDLIPEHPSEHLRAMRVWDLLTMSCGQDEDDRSDLQQESDGVWMRAFLRRPLPYAPGTHFFYNSTATYALSAILHRLTGEGLLDYLRPRLLDPLGIGEASWETDPNGIAVGGWGLYLTTDAITRFGQLLLQRGRWGDRQLVPAAWIDAATSKQVDNSKGRSGDWAQGYGYQFWRSRGNAYRGDGAFGQFCVVEPEQRLVVAITAGLADLQAPLDALWEEILPHLSDEPLPENPDAAEALKARLASLELPFPSGSFVEGSWDFGPFGLRSEERSFVLGMPEGEVWIGVDEWADGTKPFEDHELGPYAARGGWTRPDRFEAVVRYTESTASTWLVLDTASGELICDRRFCWTPGKTVIKGSPVPNPGVRFES